MWKKWNTNHKIKEIEKKYRGLTITLIRPDSGFICYNSTSTKSF